MRGTVTKVWSQTKRTNNFDDLTIIHGTARPFCIVQKVRKCALFVKTA